MGDLPVRKLKLGLFPSDVFQLGSGFFLGYIYAYGERVNKKIFNFTFSSFSLWKLATVGIECCSINVKVKEWIIFGIVNIRCKWQKQYAS